MPRNSRKKSPLNVYHVVIRGADRQLIFEEEKDYYKYLSILEYYKKSCNYDIYAYCLMSNHIHLLIHTNDLNLSSIFRHISTTYAMWFNMKYSRTGPLQQGRFYSEPVETIEYLNAVLCYIHFNPLKAGLESTLGNCYKWSSYHDYVNSNRVLFDIVDTSFILNVIGGINNFNILHQMYSQRKFECLDIDNKKMRMPDDVARDIIYDVSNCKTVTDFQNLPLRERDKYICILRQKNISERQLNRLTGVPRGVIAKIFANSRLT